MTRMNREFSLVLLSATVLTGGYFAYRNDDDLFAKEGEQAHNQVSGSHGGHAGLLYIHGGGYGSRTSAASAGGVARGGFGGIGGHSGGG
jgi:hypothetical protein